MISWPIPVPTVLTPFSSLIRAYKVGLEVVIPPLTKFSSFKYNLISGPTLSLIRVSLIPPTKSESNPLASLLSAKA